MDEPYWEISGPRKYLNIPTFVPDHWRAAVTIGSFGNYITLVGWGPTQDEAQAAARRLVVQHDRLAEIAGIADGEGTQVAEDTK